MKTSDSIYIPPHEIRRLDRLRIRFAALQLALTAVLLAAFYFSGASARLASGAMEIAGGRWWAGNALYLLVAFFGYAAILFPLRYVGDMRLMEPGEERPGFGLWMADFGKSLIGELLLGLVFFSILYALLRWWTAYWWAAAGVLYAAYAFGFQIVLPVWMLGAMEPEPEQTVADRDLADRLEDDARRAGFESRGVFFNEAEHPDEKGRIRLAGFGRARTILLSRDLVRHYRRDEICALFAREVVHEKTATAWRLTAADTLFACAAFFCADALYTTLLGAHPELILPSRDAVAGFPLFAGCLLLFQLLVMPLSNAYSRMREKAVDLLTARRLTSVNPLIRGLIRTARINTVDINPPVWFEWLWYGAPSMRKRARYLKRRRS